jgi:hypothetical protein
MTKQDEVLSMADREEAGHKKIPVKVGNPETIQIGHLWESNSATSSPISQLDV